MPETHEMEVCRYHLQPGYILTTPDPTVITTVVGSCVAVCLFDRRHKTGGMNHFLYPKPGRRERTTPCFGSVALIALIRMMMAQGSRLQDMEAQIFGGGRRPHDLADMGGRNVRLARNLLRKKGIPVVSEDVGGCLGRRVVFHTATNEAIVMKTRKIRQGDFYPYRYRLPNA